MARQVAHEIKNPLTPIRLGVQHLRRAHADARPDFPEILDRNVTRVLAEIDRLDEIARAFSKFGVRPEDAAPTEPVGLAAVVSDVVALERLGDAALQWEVDVPGDLRVRSREGELREVILNLLENARQAHASRIAVTAARGDGRVSLTIADDGDGMSDEILARAFEPRFSTRTSGSGLGLAISRRLVESWGGRIDLHRGATRGVSVTLVLDAAL
jgi:nitrogen fixation/metabolism regulation signal transduction histidine kinase